MGNISNKLKGNYIDEITIIYKITDKNNIRVFVKSLFKKIRNIVK